MNLIVIPSLEPKKELLDYVKALKEQEFGTIIIIDDGSGESYQWIFEKLQKELACIVLRNEQNKGKGYALKKAFGYITEHFSKEQVTGVITVDSDGQHTCEDVGKICDAMEQAEEKKLFLGSRNFLEAGVPKKSMYGNILTSKIFKWLYHTRIQDTQTGLRGIFYEDLSFCMNIPGERFEYETNMLIEMIKRKRKIEEIEIQTVYEDGNSGTHFNPVLDSIRIYKLFWGTFLKYVVSSLSSAVLDLLLFQLFCFLLTKDTYLVIYATVLARICSSLYNYLVNRFLVFKEEKGKSKSVYKYYALCLIQMGCSAICTWLLVQLLPFPKVAVKAVVDTILFFVSYTIQKRFVFTNKQ